MGEQGDIAIQRLKAVDQPVRARSDVLGGFPIWTAIDKDVPARPLLGDIRRAFALIIAIIPLGQVRLDLGESPKPGQLAGSLRALHRAAGNWMSFSQGASRRASSSPCGSTGCQSVRCVVRRATTRSLAVADDIKFAYHSRSFALPAPA